MIIRPLRPSDLSVASHIIDSTGLFPGELLETMTRDYLMGNAPDAHWLVATNTRDEPTGLTYYAPEPMTEGTYNLYLIAVHRDQHGRGTGQALMHYVEQELRAAGQRILLVETSGLPEFSRTRSFYTQLGYSREAVIRDFYRAGEDKVVFWKRL